jgi:energy-coupling factor transport system substrate-specific component
MTATTATTNQKLKGKDLITAGIFAAIYFCVFMIGQLLSALHPVLWILFPFVIALLAGIPYYLLCAKVQKPGAVFIMGMVTGLIAVLSGQDSVIEGITFLIGCSMAEIIRHATKYSSFKGNMIAYIFFSINAVGSPLPIWLMREKFFAKISTLGMPADYINTLDALASPYMLIVLFAAVIIGAVLGSLIAKGLFNKHFKKAGIV